MSNFVQFASNGARGLRGMSDAFRQRSDFPVETVLIVVLVFAAAGLLALLVYKLFRPFLVEKRVIVQAFNSLSLANRLTQTESDIILEMAKFYGMKNPCILFVDREKMENYFSEKIAREIGEAKTREKNIMYALEQKMFR